LYDQNVGTTDGLSFSNDGQTIAFPMRVFNAYQIHLANLDGTNVRCLTCDQRPLGWNDGVRWQPRGDHFVFVSTRDHPYAVGGAGGGFGQELYAMRSDGSEPTRLTTSGAWATNYHVNWSHDGKRVVWGTTQKHTWDVMVADFVDDARGMRLENAQRITHDTSWWETHDFTLDGKSIITTNTRAGLESTDIYAIELSSGKRRRLTSHMAWDEHAHLSPDGRKLSWISGRFNPASVARFTDGALSPAYDFFWIGPGIYFNFLAPPVGFTTELTLMNTDGTELIPLTQDHEVVADNVWSPDAKRILFRQTPTATDKTAKIRLLTFDDCR
jgi:Tol biopolymer transport system component